jgi:hypothetical protein
MAVYRTLATPEAFKTTPSNVGCCDQCGSAFVCTAEIVDAAVNLKLNVASVGKWPVSVPERLQEAKMRNGNNLLAILTGIPAKSPEFRNVCRGRGRSRKAFSIRGGCVRVRGGSAAAM